MKHVKLFEEFTASLNEEKFTKSDAKQLIKDFQTDGYEASGDENYIEVSGVDSPNSDYDGTVTMGWDPSAGEAYSDDETYEKPVKTASDFESIVWSPEDTEGMWEEGSDEDLWG